MKAKTKLLTLLGLLLAALNSQLSTCAQGTAFTYQGRLNDGANPANGSYDLRFTVYDAITNGTPQGTAITNLATGVSNGLFNVTLDFGSQFSGATRFLEVGARTNGNGTIITLSPRQRFSPTPYAIFAGAAGSFSSSVTITNLNLPTTTTNTGIIYSGSSTLLQAYGTENLFAGSGAGNLTLTGAGDTGVGMAALFHDTTGSGNSASGDHALSANTSGNFNTAAGYQALFSNSIGSSNTAFGYQTLYSNLVSANTAVGYRALMNSTNGTNNVATGFEALVSNTSGNYNTAIGERALHANTAGSLNAAIGDEALVNNTNGIENTAIGDSALHENRTGGFNIALGEAAGYFVTGSANIEIGNNGNALDNNLIRIGTQGTHTAALIAGISGSAVSGSPVFVDSNGQLGLQASSQRFKQDIQGMGNASDVLLSLRPVTFHYKPELDPKGVPQFGLVAEEVDKVDPDLVMRDDHGRIYSVRYEAVNAMLLNEFIKQHHKVEEQDAEIQSLKEKAANVDSLQKRLSDLEQMVRSLSEKRR